MNIDSFMNKYYSINPYKILGIKSNACMDEIESNYITKIAFHSTEEDINLIKHAYQLINSEEKKIKYDLLNPSPREPLNEIRKEIKSKPKYIGPGSWLKVIKEHYSENNKKSNKLY